MLDMTGILEPNKLHLVTLYIYFIHEYNGALCFVNAPEIHAWKVN